MGQSMAGYREGQVQCMAKRMEEVVGEIIN